MAIPRWRPATKVTKEEEFLLTRLTRTKKPFAFLREVRSELFNEEFQEGRAYPGAVPCLPGSRVAATLPLPLCHGRENGGGRVHRSPAGIWVGRLLVS